MIVHVVGFENLVLECLFLNCSLVFSSMYLFISCAFCLVLKIESNRKLEIALHGTTLVLTTKSIVNFNINLGSIESSITRIDRPGSSKLVESFRKRTLSLIPLVVRSKSHFWSGWKLQFKSKAKYSIDIVEEIKNAHNLVWQSFRSAEKMGVILLESTHTSKTWESSWYFISMQNTEISESDRQVPEWSNLVVKHETVARTVHGLHAETLTLNLPHKDVFLVCRIMAWGLPELQVKNVGWKNFLVSSDSVLFSNKLNQFVVDFGAVWVEEGTTGWQFMIVK